METSKKGHSKMSQSIYEITIGPKGTVSSELIEQGTNQATACKNILELTQGLGRVVAHEANDDANDAPVNAQIDVTNL